MTRLSGTSILITADAVGGVWTFATSLASALAARGAEIHLVTMGPRPRADQREMLTGSGVRLIETDLALEWQDPHGADVQAAREVLSTLAREIKPDVVHLNSYREATFNWPAPVVVTAHSCVNSWAIACNDTDRVSEPHWRHYTDYVIAGLEQADAWVAPTNAFRNVITDLYQPAIEGNFIWNGSPAPLSASFDKKPSILAAGRMWDTAKNLAALSAAASSIDWPILVAGASADLETKSATTVEMLGELSHAEVYGQMQRSSIFVSPARYEPFGLSVLEAASAGCALVLSDIPTFRELWNGCASFVDSSDTKALGAALNRLCSDASERNALQRAALLRARRYTLTRMVDGYGQLYASLMDASNAHSSAEVCA